MTKTGEAQAATGSGLLAKQLTAKERGRWHSNPRQILKSQRQGGGGAVNIYFLPSP